LCRQKVEAIRADSLSALQNLGKPLSKASWISPATLPEFSPVPAYVDFSLDGMTTRTKKCCKEVPQPDRFVSEVYPLSASSVSDSRPVTDEVGMSSRLMGRDPVIYF
jgi:hypothetical protein